MHTHLKHIIAGVFLLLLHFGCSPQKNNRATRAWHELNTRYNIYFNAEQAYRETLKRQWESYVDDYTQLLPFYPVRTVSEEAAADKASNTVPTSARFHVAEEVVTDDAPFTFMNSLAPDFQTLPEKTKRGGPFDAVVEKSIRAIQEHSITARPRRDPSQPMRQAYREWLHRQEYNPFLKNVWLLLGKAHLQNGDYAEALAVFEQILQIYRQEIAVVTEARLWMLRAYTESGRSYDAEQMVYLLQAQPLPGQWMPLFTEIHTQYLLSKRAYAEAIPYLQKSIKGTKDFRQKKRLQFLLGQLLTVLNRKEEAVRVFEKVKGLRTPYPMMLNATLYQSAITSGDAQRRMVAELKKMDKKMVMSDTLSHYRERYLIYTKTGNEALAQPYRSYMEAHHPNSRQTETETDTLHKSRLALYLPEEETLYQNAWQAYRSDSIEQVHSAYETFCKKYPQSALMPQFLFLHALAHAFSGEVTKTQQQLKQLLQRFPQSEPADPAKNILEALAAGKKPVRDGSLHTEWAWHFKQEEGDGKDADGKRSFRIEKDSTHLMLLTFFPDSIDRNRVLFAAADFNFSRFRLRTFNLSFHPLQPLEAVRIAPFRSFQEALNHLRLLQSDTLFHTRTAGNITPIIISQENLLQVHNAQSLAAYQTFYAAHYTEATSAEERVKEMAAKDVAKEETAKDVAKEETAKDVAKEETAKDVAKETAGSGLSEKEKERNLFGETITSAVPKEEGESAVPKKEEERPVSKEIAAKPDLKKGEKLQKNDSNNRAGTEKAVSLKSVPILVTPDTVLRNKKEAVLRTTDSVNNALRDTVRRQQGGLLSGNQQHTTPEERVRELERKSALALEAERTTNPQKSKRERLKEREKERRKKIRQQEEALKERRRQREAEWKQKEQARKEKIEQQKREKKKRKEKGSTFREQEKKE